MILCDHWPHYAYIAFLRYFQNKTDETNTAAGWFLLNGAESRGCGCLVVSWPYYYYYYYYCPQLLLLSRRQQLRLLSFLAASISVATHGRIPRAMSGTAMMTSGVAKSCRDAVRTWRPLSTPSTNPWCVGTYVILVCRYIYTSLCVCVSLSRRTSANIERTNERTTHTILYYYVPIAVAPGERIPKPLTFPWESTRACTTLNSISAKRPARWGSVKRM